MDVVKKAKPKDTSINFRTQSVISEVFLIVHCA